VVDGRGSYVAVDLEVIAVSEAAGTSIGSTSGYHVVLAVSAEDALRLAEAIDGGSLEVVRSTGAPDIEGGRVDP